MKLESKKQGIIETWKKEPFFTTFHRCRGRVANRMCRTAVIMNYKLCSSCQDGTNRITDKKHLICPVCERQHTITSIRGCCSYKCMEKVQKKQSSYYLFECVNKKRGFIEPCAMLKLPYQQDCMFVSSKYIQTDRRICPSCFYRKLKIKLL